jgi:parallel beta helix pectate lyase-like protein
MPVLQGKYIAGVITVAALGAGFATAPSAQAAYGVHVVRAGESIQAAVDAARAGDTVYVMPGVYHESVQITKELTLRGAGARSVTLQPAAVAEPTAGTTAGTATGTATGATAGSKPANGKPANGKPANGKPAKDQSAANGQQAGGQQANGQQAGGQQANGKPANAKPSKGQSAASGQQANGQQASGHQANGQQANGKPANAKPAKGQSAANGQMANAKPTGVKAAARPNACATAGHGICVTGTAARAVRNVRIESLTVQGFAKDGINASATDRMTVSHTVIRDNGQEGISQERSTRAALRDNQIVDNAQSGILVANLIDAEGGALDTKGTVVSGNTLTGNRIGVTVRRARVLDVESNQVTGNCGGVFVVGDENSPKAGDLDIKHNTVTANNKFCAATARMPFIQGTGILLTGAEDTRVTGNQVSDNVGTSPMSGGVVLYPSTVGVANQRDQVTGNTMSGNAPADIADRDAKGASNTFTSNTCKVSEPAGRC